MHAAFPDVLVAAIHDDVEVAGTPSRVLLALRALVAAVDEVCGLAPTGHKFVLYVPDSAAAVAPEGSVAALEDAIAGWTSEADLRAGRRCAAQADGMVTAGVPIGSAAFVCQFAMQRVTSVS